MKSQISMITREKKLYQNPFNHVSIKKPCKSSFAGKYFPELKIKFFIHCRSGFSVPISLL